MPCTFFPSVSVNPEHCSPNRRDSAVLAASQQTHIDAMEVDTPVGSSPGRNITIAVLAGRRKGGACGCQRSHRSYGFLQAEQKRKKVLIDGVPDWGCDNLTTEKEV